MTKSHTEQGLDDGEAEELSWHPSWSNSLWQGWSCGLTHYPAGNVTEPIWRVLASSDGISSWTPLKPQHSNPNPNYNPFANQLWCTDFRTPPTPSSSLTDSLPSLNLLCYSKTDARFMQDAPKAMWRIPYITVVFFPSLKHNFIAYHSSKVSSRPDCIFEVHQLWQSGFSRVYFNCHCSCSFEPEIINIGQSSQKIYSNSILNFQVSMTILNVSTKMYGNIEFITCIYIYIYIVKVKLTTAVVGDQRDPFLIASIPRCSGGHYSFLWIAPLYPWYVPYIAKC